MDPCESQPDSQQALAMSFGAVAGAGDTRSALSKVRRKLREGREDRQAAMSELDGAATEFATQAVWRRPGEGDLEVGVQAYLDAIGGTIGSRQQERFSRDQALFIARCNAAHSDISLNFYPVHGAGSPEFPAHPRSLRPRNARHACVRNSASRCSELRMAAVSGGRARRPESGTTRAAL